MQGQRLLCSGRDIVGIACGELGHGSHGLARLPAGKGRDWGTAFGDTYWPRKHTNEHENVLCIIS